MEVLGIRYCSVTDEADALIEFFGKGLGLRKAEQGKDLPPAEDPSEFSGAVFPTGDGSWIEVWKTGPSFPSGTMLQIVVDDADAWAERAKEQGLAPMGPTDAHGERIYYFQAPGGLAVTVQSKVS